LSLDVEGENVNKNFKVKAMERIDLPLYQTEQECGNGKNDWKYCLYSWSLMKHYLSNGANAYLYWNTSLKQVGISTWEWQPS
jgi:glucosylceramidase